MTRLAIGACLVVLALAGCGGQEEETPMTQPSREQPPPAGACGQPFPLPAAGPLALTPDFPSSTPASAGMVSGEVEVRASEAVSGTTSQSAAAVLVRDGRVVSESLIQDAMGVPLALEAGATKRLPAAAPLASCEQAGRALEPGEYELYVQLTVVPEDGGRIEAAGGPVALTLE